MSRPGTKADLEAIEWIIAQAPNPNSRPIQWWISRLEQEDGATLDRNLIGFWIMASLLTHNSSLMWETSQIKSLTNIEWTFTLPIGKFSRAILVDNHLAHVPSPGAWLVKGFWLQVLEMAGPKTRWRWKWRHPLGKGGSARASHSVVRRDSWLHRAGAIPAAEGLATHGEASLAWSTREGDCEA